MSLQINHREKVRAAFNLNQHYSALSFGCGKNQSERQLHIFLPLWCHHVAFKKTLFFLFRRVSILLLHPKTPKYCNLNSDLLCISKIFKILPQCKQKKFGVCYVIEHHQAFNTLSGLRAVQEMQHCISEAFTQMTTKW